MSTLWENYRKAHKDRWSELRDGGLSVTTQARAAIRTILALSGNEQAGDMPVEDVTAAQLQQAVDLWRSAGLSAGTINKRLGCLSSVGVIVSIRRMRRPRVAKWWLRPEQERRIYEGYDGAAAQDVKDYVRWATQTGLRVEETLRLTRQHFGGLDDPSRVSITVPGTKTALSGNVKLPVSPEAAEVAIRRLATRGPNAPLFDMSYNVLMGHWQSVRSFLGIEGVPLATLKALRRSAARHLHVGRGMPLDVVRTYLRHENIATTMEYLRLTGGYDADTMRQWL